MNVKLAAVPENRVNYSLLCSEHMMESECALSRMAQLDGSAPVFCLVFLSACSVLKTSYFSTSIYIRIDVWHADTLLLVWERKS